MIYFDNAATTPVLDCAWEAMRSCEFANPSSSHAAGRAAKAALEETRSTIASCLGCRPSEVYFTSGATEACNWMVQCLHLQSGGIMYDRRLHHAVLEPIYAYHGPSATNRWPSAVLSLVNNETGEINDVDDFCRKYRPHRIGVDATAAVSHIPIDFLALGADYMAFGGHKFGAPKGIGALIVREGCPITPLLHGGAQERGMRGGTVSVPLTSAMAAALAWHTKNMADNAEKIRRVRDQLIFDLAQLGVDHIVNLNDGHRHFADHILSIRFPGVYGAALAAALSENGVMVSTGSACSSGDNTASANLMASGLTEQEALETIRFSFDWYNTPKEASDVAALISSLTYNLRRG